MSKVEIRKNYGVKNLNRGVLNILRQYFHLEYIRIKHAYMLYARGCI